MPKSKKAGFSIPGSRTLSNLSRAADKYGDVHFISFYSAILARLAYTNDNNFLKFYKSIFGPIIPSELMKSMDQITDFKDILNDEKMFKLKGENKDKFKTYTYKDQLFIDFIGEGMPQNTNVATGEISQARSPPDTPKPKGEIVNNVVKYISISWSNYGEIYVLADKRMPKSIFVIFRGTYSAKTAALYSKPTSAIPLQVCLDSNGKPESYLYGIFKASVEMIHTIIESMRYLATDFLGAKDPDSVKVITTGHSLGGAMCSDFAYLWVNSITKTSPYNSAPYDILSKKIICISLGSPRCFNTNISEKFCNYVEAGNIVYLRITTRGDPVPALPPSATYFSHACSDSNSVKKGMREKVSEDCNATLTMRPYPNVDYKASLDCQNYKTRTYIPNMLSHTIYLDIMYTNAVDIPKFATGVVFQQEVKRTPSGGTIGRLIIGSDEDYKVVFFDVNASRSKPTNIDAAESTALTSIGETPIDTSKLIEEKSTTMQSPSAMAAGSRERSGGIGGAISEDVRVDKNTFDKLISLSVPIKGSDKCPMLYSDYQLFTSFSNTLMPTLQCAPKVGGRKRKRTRKHSKRNKRFTKTKRNRH
jgi:hypothetical protein